MQFSANLGFLWTDRPLPDRILAAKAAGFDAVECHFPFETPVAQIRDALAQTGMRMISLNTRPGDPALGEFGLCSLPGREADARAVIDEALAYAAAIKAATVHVMAGCSGDDGCFKHALRYACMQAAPLGIGILIEPINTYDVPGYFLTGTQQAADIIHELRQDNLAMMFDCYHVARMEGDVLARFNAVAPVVGHVQFAAVPGRGVPNQGVVDYAALLPALQRAGWQGAFGAEYRPDGDTDASLGWMGLFQR